MSRSVHFLLIDRFSQLLEIVVDIGVGDLMVEIWFDDGLDNFEMSFHKFFILQALSVISNFL